MDGAAARYAAWKALGNSATYISVQYNEQPPELEDNSEVYILDFSYSREILEAWNARMSKLVVLDHHKTAQKDLEGLPYAKFNMNKSGAMMAWDYFHPHEVVPFVFHLVQDRDLWKFEWQGTREFHAGFQTRREDINQWQKVTSSDEEGRYLRETVLAEGKIILAYEDNLVKDISNFVRYVPFLHTHVAIVNSPMLRDELGAALNKREIWEHPRITGVIIYFFEPEINKFKLSFRSLKGTDWSWVAKRLGGGGHATSCNATVDIDTLNQILEGRFRQLPPLGKPNWIGRIRNWFNTKLRLWEEALHSI
jgi:hypothetical protein